MSEDPFAKENQTVRRHALAHLRSALTATDPDEGQIRFINLVVDYYLDGIVDEDEREDRDPRLVEYLVPIDGHPTHVHIRAEQVPNMPRQGAA